MKAAKFTDTYKRLKILQCKLTTLNKYFVTADNKTLIFKFKDPYDLNK